MSGKGLSANEIFARTHQNLTDELSSQRKHDGKILLCLFIVE
jgi:hypothetical protein